MKAFSIVILTIPKQLESNAQMWVTSLCKAKDKYNAMFRCVVIRPRHVTKTNNGKDTQKI